MHLVARPLLISMLSATVLGFASESARGQRVLPTTYPPRNPAAWTRDAWTQLDGLPVNSITQVLQSQSGYIWATTFDGLVRFDGARFTVYNSSNTPGLKSNRLLWITELRDSSLWVISEG